MAREKDDTEWAKDLRAEKMAGKGHIGVMGDDIWRRVERLTSHATTWIFGSRWRTDGGRFVVMHLFLIVRGLKDCRALVTRSWKGHGVLSCQSTKNVVAIALPFASQEREPVSYCFRKVLEKTL